MYEEAQTKSHLNRVAPHLHWLKLLSRKIELFPQLISLIQHPHKTSDLSADQQIYKEVPKSS